MTKQELQAMLEKLEARWHSGNLGGPQEIVKLDKQMKELRKRIMAME
jgi:hypothetical protein